MPPTRTCIGCRAICPASELVRLVLRDRQVEIAPRSAGRGAWLHPRADCARAAIKARAFSRAFRQAVASPSSDDLIAALEAAAQPRP
jgi:predicted RNA-binding protein YlxR (DUF448 family)